MSGRRVNRICVFCGASLGARPEYAAVAEELGALMAGRGLGLVYGGTSIGLMGRVADAVLAGGGEAIGVLPAALKKKEIAHTGLTRLDIVESLAERKATMAELSDAFAALPGGLGTLDEVSEMLTWRQLGYQDKPVALLNTAGYFDALLRFIGHGVSEGLVRPAHAALLGVADTPAALLQLLAP